MQLAGCGELSPSSVAAEALSEVLRQLTDSAKPPLSGPTLMAHNAFHREAMRSLLGTSTASVAGAAVFAQRAQAASAYLALVSKHGPPPPPESGVEWMEAPKLVAARLALMLGHGQPGVAPHQATEQLSGFLYKAFAAGASASADGAMPGGLERAVVSQLLSWMPPDLPAEWRPAPPPTLYLQLLLVGRMAKAALAPAKLPKGLRQLQQRLQSLRTIATLKQQRSVRWKKAALPAQARSSNRTSTSTSTHVDLNGILHPCRKDRR